MGSIPIPGSLLQKGSTMLWKGNALTAKEDFGEAMVQLKDQEEAEKFRAIFESAFPTESESLLGFLTGECEYTARPRVRKLLNVVYPFEETNDIRVILTQGMTLNDTNPELAALILSIPRRSWWPFTKAVSRT
jgi:hypothetical protein